MKFIFLILTLLGAVSCVSSETTSDKNKEQNNRIPAQQWGGTVRCEVTNGWCWAPAGDDARVCECPGENNTWLKGVPGAHAQQWGGTVKCKVKNGWCLATSGYNNVCQCPSEDNTWLKGVPVD